MRDRYSAIGINLDRAGDERKSLCGPAGGSALSRHAEEQALARSENRVARDVRVAWLDAQTAFQRLDLTDQLAAQASDALDLAQQRYNLGLSSIVELTQAQLNQTRAQIEQATARYDYLDRTTVLRFQTGELR